MYLNENINKENEKRNDEMIDQWICLISAVCSPKTESGLAVFRGAHKFRERMSRSAK